MNENNCITRTATINKAAALLRFRELSLQLCSTCFSILEQKKRRPELNITFILSEHFIA